MTIFYNKIIGLPVIIKDNKKVGIIKDIFIDPDIGQVLGLVLSLNKIIDKRIYVFYDDIVKFGKGGIEIKNKESVKSLTDISGSQKKSIEKNFKIINSKVITIAEDNLGNVSDIEIDVISGKILKIFVRGGIIRNLIRGELIVSRNQIIEIKKSEVIVQDIVVKSNKPIQEPIAGEKKLAGAGLYIKIT
jgi:uncharacterized protein YrrD